MQIYNLNDIKNSPSILTYKFHTPKLNLILRPLEENDVEILTTFFENLSDNTRNNYKLKSYDKSMAEEFCRSIAKYDKLRFILLNENRVIGLFEFSIDLPDSDLNRLKKYNIETNLSKVCRFGPCIADDHQGKGLAKACFQYIKNIALKIDKNYIVLWGGVFTENTNAIKFYESIGFSKLGIFFNSDRKECIDMGLSLKKS